MRGGCIACEVSPPGQNPSTMKRIQFLQGAAVALLCMAASSASLAQSYPNKPIRLIVPFPAGGATDLFARTLGQKMGEKLGTQLIIDNKPGAGGAIGSDQAAKAPADGYTLLLATTSTHSIGPAVSRSCPTTRCATSRPSAMWAMRPASCWCRSIRQPRRCASGSTTPRRTPASSITHRAATAPSCSSRPSSSRRRPACS
jgi:tripartite-type tricarboxylate transporter receptor subunit TctC